MQGQSQRGTPTNGAIYWAEKWPATRILRTVVIGTRRPCVIFPHCSAIEFRCHRRAIAKTYVAIDPAYAYPNRGRFAALQHALGRRQRPEPRRAEKHSLMLGPAHKMTYDDCSANDAHGGSAWKATPPPHSA